MKRHLILVVCALVAIGTRAASPATGEEQAGPGLSAVTFDANGGTLGDTLRMVRTGGTYGENVNLYPGDSASAFADLPGDKITLSDGVFSYATADRWCNYWTKPIARILPNRPYTYVIDVLSYENESPTAPWFNLGHTGDDQPAQLSGASVQVTGPGRLVRTLTGRDVTSYTTLERAYLDFNHADGGVCRMTFRVGLYAGRDAVPTGTDPVASGGLAACALPVPVRPGYVFAGWTDAAGSPVTAETEVTAREGQDHVLVAAWRRAPGAVIPVKVTFDADGGRTTEKFRIVNTEQPYGRTVNLYPSDARANFHDLPSDRITLADNLFTLHASQDAWVNMFTKNVDRIEIGEAYTYVVEVLSVEGDLGWLSIGRTGGYWAGGQQIQLAGTGIQLGSRPGVYATPVVGADYEEGFTSFNYLARDYFHMPADTRATFRIALFAGTGVTPENFAYVAPGQGLPLPLPVAAKAGKVFDCWVDAAGNRVTDETVVDADGDVTLTARWKPWTASVVNGDRPQAGKPLTLATNYGDGTRADEDGVVGFAWYRGNWKGEYEAEPVSSGATYVPTAADREHFLKGVVSIDGVEVLSTALWFSRLPVVYVDTADGADILVKTNEKGAAVRIQGNAEFKQQYDGAALVKGRGNSSWGMPKKPYKVKLDKKASLFGFGKNKHWVLLANYIDVSSLRNKVAYDMSGAFGLTYQDSTWVEVVFNGRFDGTYQLCEHVRVGDTRVDVFDWEDFSEKEGHTAEDLSWIDQTDLDVSGGYLWELSNEYDDVSKFKIDVTGDGESDEDIPLMFSRPEFACTSARMMAWSRAFWQDVYAAWTSTLNATADGSKSWRDLCDVDSMVSYWLINEIFGNDDAWYKSRYCHKDLGGKLTFGPVWDFDWGLGSVVVGMGSAEKWRLAQNNNSGWPVSFYKEWLDDPWFCLRAYEKYWEMRPAFTALLAPDGDYDRYAAYLAEAGLVEDARWDARRTESYGANKRTQAGDTALFREWLTTRLAWLDGQFASPDAFMANVRNDASAQPYTDRAADKLGVAVVGVPASRGDLRIGVDVKSSTGSVDVLVNGRHLKTARVTKYGHNAGTVDEIVLPRGTWYERGHRTLVELVGHNSDSGAVNYRSHVIVEPVGAAGWEDVTAETATDEIVPAAQAAQLDALGVPAAKVAAWALAQGVAFDPERTIDLRAFALNCAPAGVAAGEAAFRLSITIDADGTPHVALPADRTYNVEPRIQGRPRLESGDWHDPRTDGDRFFRAVIGLPENGEGEAR